jgi:hypothetical protein
MGGESTKREREQGEVTERERAIDREKKGEGTGNSEQRNVLGGTRGRGNGINYCDTVKSGEGKD